MVDLTTKGIYSPNYITLTLMGSGFWTILGTAYAYPRFDLGRFILMFAAACIGQGVVAHSIHDYLNRRDRTTFSARTLRFLAIAGISAVLALTFILASFVGPEMMLFATVALVACFYGRLYNEIMLSIGAAILVSGSYYTQTRTITTGILALAAFISILAWAAIHTYRLDNHGWSVRDKDLATIGICLSIPFLALSFVLK